MPPIHWEITKTAAPGGTTEHWLCSTSFGTVRLYDGVGHEAIWLVAVARCYVLQKIRRFKSRRLKNDMSSPLRLYPDCMC